MKRILIEESVIDPKACSYGFPWKRDSICYNFNMPQECITVADIDKLTDKTEIETLVIGCNLDSYVFISDMTGLRQLYIYKGDNVTNIEFLRNLTRLQQLYIVGSHIRDIDPIYELALKKERLFNVETEPFKRMNYMIEGLCIDSRCDIQGADRLKNEGIYISELIINRKHIK